MQDAFLRSLIDSAIMQRVSQLLSCFICSFLLMTGCGGTTAPSPEAKVDVDRHEEDEHKDGDEHEHKTAAKKSEEHDHSGWWCDEHGVPEGICAQCDSKLAAEFQKKGDWCKEHDRPDSQCFKCHPELEAKFAAQYVAKYGKQPPNRNNSTI